MGVKEIVVLIALISCVHGQESSTADPTTPETISSSRGPKCAPHTCRMLCPYGFEQDSEGCVQCECKNPCKGIQCSGDHECQVDDSNCKEGEPCNPVANCRQSKALHGACAFGDPLTSAGTSRPLLCGDGDTKPSCPPQFDCTVQDGAEYGVCCPSSDISAKMGECPSSVPIDFKCDANCASDSECGDGLKCCPTSCGSTCLSARNSTICEQQKRVSTLLSGRVDSPAYIPQCDDEGQFVPKQCSTNGKVCWCVNQAGQQIAGSMGPSSAVTCTTGRRQFGRSQKIEVTHSCSLVMCDVICEYGYKKDDRGCSQCECVDPCETKKCDPEEECVIVKEEPCGQTPCVVSASCRSKKSDTTICTRGRPLVRDNATVNCAEAEGCAEGYDCEILPSESMGICCERTDSDDAASASERIVPDEMVVTEREETTESPKIEKISTMCEYLKDMGSMGEKLAVPVPSCGEDGRYLAVQCDGAGCFCVDDFGAELNNSRAEKKEEVECRQMRSAKPCYNLLCRLGCDYGFEYDEEGCPVCACRNPCKNSNCSQDEVCQLVEPTRSCHNRWCPPVPKCISKETAQLSLKQMCPGSTQGPLMHPESQEVLQCYLESEEDSSCPSGYFCLPTSTDTDSGLCCPNTYENEVRSLEGASANNKEQQEVPDIKPGQCPYLIPFDTPVAAMSCEYQCNTDKLCPHNLKCCSNGCGTQCMQPVQMTACEHTRTIVEHAATASQLNLNVLPKMPSCSQETRDFDPMQCHGEACWCADRAGIEMVGTRTDGVPKQNCTALREGAETNTTCSIECNVNCEFGQRLDDMGCPSSCECIDPCQELSCGHNEECRLMILSCVGKGPCPRQAMCRPRVDNSCIVGSPMVNGSSLIHCGPDAGMCPTSHKCQLDIFGEFSHCCPKPREICYSAPPMCTEPTQQSSSEQRWFYNPMEKMCQRFQHHPDFCHHGLNFFSSKQECQTVCPVYSECELKREKAYMQMKNSDSPKPVYVPKCNSRLGTWDPIQCLNDIGLCWCVDQQGNQLPGSMVRGTPNCFLNRSARHLSPPSICSDGQPVHICDADEVCGEKMCAARSNATCRVDPCGGCRAVFYDEFNQMVDCHKGLTACQEEAQTIINSRAWANQGLNTISNLVSALRELSEGMQEELLSSASSFVSPMDMMARQSGNMMPVPHEFLRRIRRSPKFIVDNQEVNHKISKRDVSDEISDYDDPAARAMSAYHSSRRRHSDPIATGYSELRPKVMVPMRGPIVMVVHRRIVPSHSPIDLMQALTSNMPKVRIMIPVPESEPPKMFVEQMGGRQERPVDPRIERVDASSGEMERAHLPGLDPAAFMSHITAIMDKVMTSVPETFAQSPQEPQASERLVVGPNFAEMSINMKAKQAVPPEALKQIEQGSLDALLNYLFGGHPAHQESRETVITIKKPDPLPECPRGGFADTIRSMVSGCRNECNQDRDCSSNERCCQYGCSTTCVEPSIARMETQEHRLKPGLCPTPVMSAQCLFPKIQCMEDGHCPGQQKCCKSPCGSMCVTPGDIEPTVVPATMVVAPPVCSSDGGYSVSQSQGQLSWCVDRFGVPIDTSLTRGSVSCDVNGTITKRESTGPVCPEGKSSRVCRDQCNTATCFSHPDAMCVADPCNDCKIHFVDPIGDKVDCSPVCEQNAFKSSECTSNSGVRTRTRYSFNQTSQQCELFNYQCNGNDNNFETDDDCEKECKTPKSVCELPKERGLCMGAFMKWWYNPVSEQCEEFTYGGCGGNANNFETLAACEMTCPDIVMCPYDTITKEGLTKEPCDRVAVCAATSCPGDSTAVCQVDPCECIAEYVKSETGERADCEVKEESINEVVAAIRPRCVAMQKKNAVSGELYVPDCDNKGVFLPKQCISVSGKGKECWCVDMAGNQIGEPFTDGARYCTPVKIARVDVDLAFEQSTPMGDMDETKNIVGKTLKRTLRSIDAHLADDKVDISLSSSILHAGFSLLGDNCSTTAYQIEQLVKRKMFTIDEAPLIMAADYKNSRFHYVPQETNNEDVRGSGRVEVIYSADKNEVLAVKRLIEGRMTVDSRTTTLAAAILAVTVVMCMLLLATVWLHRKKHFQKKESFDQSMPDGMMTSFQNPVYALWTNKLMSSVCRRSPMHSPPKSPDVAEMEAQLEMQRSVEQVSREVDDEFNNPNYEVIDDSLRNGSKI